MPPHDIVLPNGFTPFEPDLAPANDWLDEVPPASPDDPPWAAEGDTRRPEATPNAVNGHSLHHGPAIGIAGADVSRWVGKTAPDVVFAVAELIPSGAASVVGGDGGAGKGVLLQTMSSCIALGLPFLGRATRHGTAVYISAEDPEAFFTSGSNASRQSSASTSPTSRAVSS